MGVNENHIPSVNNTRLGKFLFVIIVSCNQLEEQTLRGNRRARWLLHVVCLNDKTVSFLMYFFLGLL